MPAIASLKSRSGEHKQLVQFIRQNWFVMNSLATRWGLMNAYKLLDAGETAPGNWNLSVAVAYSQPEGYDGVKEAFQAIRRAHVNQLVDGLDLLHLETIVALQKIYERILAPTTGRVSESPAKSATF